MVFCFFFFKQKTAYEMRISDWSSDVCSSDLNACLWPLFHYRLDLTSFDRRFYDRYQRVNRRFSSALLPLLRDDDLIWVHDYHLLPFGEMLREAGCRQKLGFFLHIPFPVREIFAPLPILDRIARPLLAYDP